MSHARIHLAWTIIELKNTIIIVPTNWICGFIAFWGLNESEFLNRNIIFFGTNLSPPDSNIHHPVYVWRHSCVITHHLCYKYIRVLCTKISRPKAITHTLIYTLVHMFAQPQAVVSLGGPSITAREKSVIDRFDDSYTSSWSKPFAENQTSSKTIQKIFWQTISSARKVRTF